MALRIQFFNCPVATLCLKTKAKKLFKGLAQGSRLWRIFLDLFSKSLAPLRTIEKSYWSIAILVLHPLTLELGKDSGQMLADAKSFVFTCFFYSPSLELVSDLVSLLYGYINSSCWKIKYFIYKYIICRILINLYMLIFQKRTFKMMLINLQVLVRLLLLYNSIIPNFVLLKSILVVCWFLMVN